METEEHVQSGNCPPLMQWTPEQTIYPDAESIHHDIEVLLTRLQEFGEESMLVSASDDKIHLNGTAKGKKFLEENEDIARLFHQNCYGNSESKEYVFSQTEEQKQRQGENESESKSVDSCDQTGEGNNKNDTNDIKESSTQASDIDDASKKLSGDKEVVKRKRGRPRKSTAMPDSKQSKETSLPQEMKKVSYPDETSKKITQSDKLEKDYGSPVESKKSETPAVVESRRSGRRIKRKVIESLGYIPPKEKFSKLEIKEEVMDSENEDQLSGEFSTNTDNLSEDSTVRSPAKTAKTNRKTPTELTKKDVETEVSKQDEQTEDLPGDTEEIKADLDPSESIIACKSCGFSSEVQEEIENHIRMEHPEMWEQILADDTKILLALGRKEKNQGTTKNTPGKEVKEGEVANIDAIPKLGLVKKEVSEEKDLHPCSICGKNFKNISFLKAHISLMHKVKNLTRLTFKRSKEHLQKQWLDRKKRLREERRQRYLNNKYGKISGIKTTENGNGKDSDEAKQDSDKEYVSDPEDEETSVNKTKDKKGRNARKKKLDPDFEESFADSDENEDYEEPYSCQLCLKSLQTQKKLEQHYESTGHDKVTFTDFPCLTCNRFFISLKILELHMKQSGHMGEEMNSLDGERIMITQNSNSKRGGILHICSLCKREFVKMKNCEKHIALGACKKVWKKFCPILTCRKLFFENNLYYVHLNTEHKGQYPFECKHEGCNRKFFYITALNSHAYSHKTDRVGVLPRNAEDNKQRCCYCGMVFKLLHNLNEHVRKIHGDESFKNNVTNKLDEKSEMTEGSQENDENEEVEEEEEPVENKNLTIHDHVSGNEFKCYTCNMVFSEIDLVSYHMMETGHNGLPEGKLDGERKVIERKRKSGVTVYACSLCRLEFKKLETCEVHTEEKICKKKYKRMCPIMSCRIVFKNFNFFQAHMLSMHKDVYPFKCSECGKEFEYTAALNSHRNSHFKDAQFLQADVLNSDKPMTCNYCKMRFRDGKELHEHKVNVHEVERKFTCEYCGKKYKRKDNLKEHVKNTHEKDPNSNKVCPTCGKVLSSARSLKFHLRFAHVDTKPCICEICGFRTKQLGNLAFHMRNNHSNARPYKCEREGCGKTFKDRQLWQRHMQRHEIAAGDLEKAKTYGPVNQCPECGKGFCGKYNLEKHMLCHTSECPLSCQICGKAVKRMGSLRRHLRNVHHTDSIHDNMVKVRPISMPTYRKNKPIMQKIKIEDEGVVECEIPADTLRELASTAIEEYQFQCSEAQQKFNQILTSGVGETEVHEAVVESFKVNTPKSRDFISEAENQVAYLECNAGSAENVIEEAVEESQIIIENAGEQYIIMNPDLNLEQLEREIIIAVKNDDGSVSFQLASGK